MIAFSIIKKSQLEGAKRLDAEYYQPEYLEFEKRIKSSSYKLWRDIEGRFITGPFGSEFNVENYITDGKYRYIRGRDVKEFFLLDNDNVYIPERDFERLRKYSLNVGDILISVVGTLGDTAIVYQDNLPAIFSCKGTAFRTKAINPYYFLAYLNSKYGSGFLERSVRGTVQTGLNINDLKDLPVYIPPEQQQSAIGSIAIQAKTELENSKSLYSQAENLLLEELGLKNFEVENELWSVVKLSEVKKVKRIDAEYFQPKYEQLLYDTKKDADMKLLEEVASVKRGSLIAPRFYNNTIGTPYIRGGDFSSGRFEKTGLVYINNDFQPKSETRVKEGDIVFASIGSVGTLAVVPKEFNGSFISNNTTRISIKNKNDLIPEYLGLVLHSVVGRFQFEKEMSQTAQPKISDSQVKSFHIPILPKPTQQKIAELVRKSHEARKKAKELLESAKRKVEQMIENAG